MASSSSQSYCKCSSGGANKPEKKLADQRLAEFNRLMAEGKDKHTAKQYGAAVNAFDAALLVMAGDRTASQALLEAKEALAKSDDDNKKRTQVRAECNRIVMLGNDA